MPRDAELSFPRMRVGGGRAYVSGRGPLESGGPLAKPPGKVRAEVTEAEGCLPHGRADRSGGPAAAAERTRRPGPGPRAGAGARMVSTPPGFARTPAVPIGFSDLIVQLQGKGRPRT